MMTMATARKEAAICGNHQPAMETPHTMSGKARMNRVRMILRRRVKGPLHRGSPLSGSGPESSLCLHRCRRRRVGLDLLAVPVEVTDHHQGAHQTADGAKAQPLGKGNAGGVGGDHHREGVDGGEGGAHGGGKEDGPHADDGVIAERQKDGHQDGIEGDGLLLQPAGGAPSAITKQTSATNRNSLPRVLRDSATRPALKAPVLLMTPISPPSTRMKTMMSAPLWCP